MYAVCERKRVKEEANEPRERERERDRERGSHVIFSDQ